MWWNFFDKLMSAFKYEFQMIYINIKQKEGKTHTYTVDTINKTK